MENTDVNYIAVLIATVINMVVGTLWYSPVLFGNVFTKALGKSDEELKAMKRGIAKMYIFALAGALISSYVLGLMITMTNARTIADVVQLSFWLWLGFVVTTGLLGVVFENRNKTLYMLQSGYYLVVFILAGLVFLFVR